LPGTKRMLGRDAASQNRRRVGGVDYRAKGRTRYKAMTLEPGEFMRRFLLHVLPGGFHRIRNYGVQTFVRGETIRAPPQLLAS